MIVLIFLIYKTLFGFGITPKGDISIIYIPTGSSYSQVLDTLETHLTIKNPKILNWVAEKKKYPLLVKAGQVYY